MILDYVYYLNYSCLVFSINKLNLKTGKTNKK